MFASASTSRKSLYFLNAPKMEVRELIAFFEMDKIFRVVGKMYIVENFKNWLLAKNEISYLHIANSFKCNEFTTKTLFIQALEVGSPYFIATKTGHCIGIIECLCCNCLFFKK